MKCDICGSGSGSGSGSGTLIMGQGFACSEDCQQIANGRRKAFIDELKAEPINTMPEQLETHDFERWSLKFAVHFLDGLSDGDRKRLARSNPIFLSPEHLALDFKERIISHLHKAYVSDVEHRGHDRMFSSGTYCFRQPVPAEKIIEACRKAQLIN